MEIKTKKCSKCQEIKQLDNFSRCRSCKDGLGFQCKLCHNAYVKSKYIENPIIKEIFNYGEKRCSRCKEIKQYHEFGFDRREKDGLKHSCKICRKKYDNKNPYINAWRKVLENCLNRMGRVKEGHTIDILGYSALELKNSVENMFTEGMTWDNYGEWHIDHIKLVRSFNNNTPPSIVNALSNLRPLWATTKEINGIIYEGNLNRKRYYDKQTIN
jgi:hypothetical protein